VGQVTGCEASRFHLVEEGVGVAGPGGRVGGRRRWSVEGDLGVRLERLDDGEDGHSLVIEIESVEIIRIAIIGRHEGEARLISQRFPSGIAGDFARGRRGENSTTSQPTMKAEGERLHREGERFPDGAWELDDAVGVGSQAGEKHEDA